MNLSRHTVSAFFLPLILQLNILVGELPTISNAATRLYVSTTTSLIVGISRFNHEVQ